MTTKKQIFEQVLMALSKGNNERTPISVFTNIYANRDTDRHVTLWENVRIRLNLRDNSNMFWFASWLEENTPSSEILADIREVHGGQIDVRGFFSGRFILLNNNKAALFNYYHPYFKKGVFCVKDIIVQYYDLHCGDNKKDICYNLKWHLEALINSNLHYTNIKSNIWEIISNTASAQVLEAHNVFLQDSNALMAIERAIRIFT
jgi:hypothetical protein